MTIPDAHICNYNILGIVAQFVKKLRDQRSETSLHATDTSRRHATKSSETATHVDRDNSTEFEALSPSSCEGDGDFSGAC